MHRNVCSSNIPMRPAIRFCVMGPLSLLFMPCIAASPSTYPLAPPDGSFRNPVALSPDSADPKVAQLAKWLTERCQLGSVHSLGLGNFFIGESSLHAGDMFVTWCMAADFRLGDSDNYTRGVGFNRDVAAKDPPEVLGCIPGRCWMDPVGPPMPSRLSTLRERYRECQVMEFRAAIWIAEELEMGMNSSWAPYLAMLPTAEDYESYHPAYGAFMGETPRPKIQVVDDWLSDAFSDLRKCWDHYQSDASRPASLKSVMLSLLHFQTHAFDVGTVGEHIPGGLAPLLDLINTAGITSGSDMLSQTAVHRMYVKGEGPWAAGSSLYTGYSDKMYTCVELRSRSVKRGQQVTYDYGAGKKSPLEMFLQYGFALDSSEHRPTSQSEKQVCDELLANSDLRHRTNSISANWADFAERFCADQKHASEL